MDLVFASAVRLAAAIRSGEVSSSEVVEAHLDRIERHNPGLNAVVTLDAEGARARARAADEARARGENWGSLHGVPYTLKDSHATAGMRTTAGHPPLADYVPTEDGTVAARLRAAGGVLLGKTNVPELLVDIQTDNPVFGRTLNPWDPARTPGGSSGGAAAALARGMTPIDIGSDVGGSIRIPAHFCGVFGLKTTEHRVSSFGHIPDLPGAPRSVRVLASIGPMARTAEDLALLYRIVAGPDGLDAELPPVPVEDVPEVTLGTLRVAFAPTFPGFPVAGDVRAAIEAFASAVEPFCAAMEDAPLPDLDYDRAALSEIDTMAVRAMVPGDPAEPPPTLAQYLRALDRRDRFLLAWEAFFDRWDVLVCPASMVTAFPHCPTGTPLDVDGVAVDYWMANAHCKLFSYTGHPAVAMPVTADSRGLPLGVQLVGKRWSESRLLAIAAALSAVVGTPPGYPPTRLRRQAG